MSGSVGGGADEDKQEECKEAEGNDQRQAAGVGRGSTQSDKKDSDQEASREFL